MVRASAAPFTFVFEVFRQSAIHFMAIFGLILLGAAVLTALSRLTSNTFRQFVYPRFGLYAFGWIGVPVHEFCHAFFCKLFLHDVKKVKWFDPAGRGGAQGFVKHEYNPWNPYHRLGHFFIGLGPVLLAPVLLALLFYALVPGTQAFFQEAPAGIGPEALLFARVIVNKVTLRSPGFYLFLYIATCISSQMELSAADLRQALVGVVPIFLVLLVVNSFSLLGPERWQTGWQSHALTVGLRAMSLASVLYTFSALLALVNLALCLFTMTLVNRCMGREGINPFKS